MTVDNIPSSSVQALAGTTSNVSNAKSDALALIDSNVAKGLMSSEDAEFLKKSLNGGDRNFSSSNGFLNDLVDLLKFSAETKSQVTLTRFEILDKERIAKIDAAQQSLDGARIGFIVTVAGSAASMGLGASADTLGVKTGMLKPSMKNPDEPETSIVGVVINLSSQISQSAATWSTQSYEYQAATARADADQYGALGRSDVLNNDLEGLIRQAIAASAN